MDRELLPKSLLILVLAVIVLPVVIVTFQAQPTASAQTSETSGSLTVVDPQGNPKAMCPSKHTDLKAQISGFISRVVVTQQFVAAAYDAAGDPVGGATQGVTGTALLLVRPRFRSRFAWVGLFGGGGGARLPDLRPALAGGGT